MSCNRCREALSAMADGEGPGIASDLVDRHLLSCPACRTYGARLEATLPEAPSFTDEPGGPPPDLTDRIVARLGRERLVKAPKPAGATRDRPLLDVWRISLLIPAIGHLVAALAALGDDAHAGGLHATHDLGALALALSAGFVLAAFRPQWAAGFVPLLSAVVASLAVVAVVDVVTGRVAAVSELPHLVDLFGLVTLIAVARQQPRVALRPSPA